MAWNIEKIAACGLLALTSSVTALAGVQDRAFFRASSVVIVFGADDFSENAGEAPVVFDFYLLDNQPSDTAALDIIGADGVSTNFNTGQYNASSNGSESGWEFQLLNQTSGGAFISAGPHQTLDANDAFTPFGLDETTDMDLLGNGNRASRFFVTSNAPFDIYAQASDLTATGDFSGLDYSNIAYSMRLNRRGGSGVNRWGDDAQNPSTGGAGLIVPGNFSWTLDNISAGPTKVFDGGRRTARRRGSIMTQAVSFQSRYRLRGAGITGNNYDLSMGAGELGAQVTYTVYTP